MNISKTRAEFYNSEKCKEIRQVLEAMTKDKAYNTSPSYSSNKVLYPDNLMSFVDKHMNYIVERPSLDPDLYLSNLKLITRLK